MPRLQLALLLTLFTTQVVFSAVPLSAGQALTIDTPQPVFEGGLLRLAISWEGISGTTISWQVDGATRSNNSPVLLEAVDHDTVAHPADVRSLSAVCVVKDSQDIVLAQVAWTDIRVWDVDRAPTAPTVAIAPVTPTSADDLAVTIVSPASDPDGDAITGYAVRWQLQSAARQAFTGLHLPATETRRGDNWTATVEALTDPYADGVASIGPSVITTVSISNTAPVAEDRLLPLFFARPSELQIPAFDPDAEEGADSLTFAITEAPSSGAISGLDASSGSFTYTPETGFVGIDSLRYTVTDLAGSTASGLLELNVGAYASFDLHLRSGWNLVSIPVSLAQLPPSLQPGQPLIIFGWAETDFIPVDEMQAGIGYLVFSPQTQILALEGQVDPGPAPLPTSGWNLAGVLAPPPFDAVSLVGAYSPEPTPDVPVWYLSRNLWRAVTELHPGRAYWVYRD